jgi:hypothetical protein
VFSIELEPVYIKILLHGNHILLLFWEDINCFIIKVSKYIILKEKCITMKMQESYPAEFYHFWNIYSWVRFQPLALLSILYYILIKHYYIFLYFATLFFFVTILWLFFFCLYFQYLLSTAFGVFLLASCYRAILV